MNKIKQYFKKFIADRSGMELMQWLVVILISVLVMGVAMTIGKNVSTKMKEANEFADGQFGMAINQAQENQLTAE